jgi:ribulose 1,5-bisphosphate synthetase/thiazole synthase
MISAWDQHVDVLIGGGGSAGCSAAIAAARAGARTLVVERNAFLGGTGAGTLDTFYGAYSAQTPKKVVGGIFDRLVARLRAMDEVMYRPNVHGGGIGVAYNPAVLKVAWEQLAVEAGADVLYGAVLIAATEDADGIEVTLGTKAGPRNIRAARVIDATGDADVCMFLGGQSSQRGPDDPIQTLTTVMHISGVESNKFEAIPHEVFKATVAEARSTGAYDVPHASAVLLPTVNDGIYIALASRVNGCDPLDPWSLSHGEREGRRQSFEFLRLFRDHIDGFETAKLVSFSNQIGVRESRRIVGAYQLDESDVLSSRKFDDVVAQSGSPIEQQLATGVKWTHIPADGVYDIPFRSLLPVGINKAIVAGRCLSASHRAHASCRLIAQCIAMGEAAGTAAALSLAEPSDLRDIDIARLQRQLLDHGAVLYDHQHRVFGA